MSGVQKYRQGVKRASRDKDDTRQGSAGWWCKQEEGGGRAGTLEQEGGKGSGAGEESSAAGSNVS